MSLVEENKSVATDTININIELTCDMYHFLEFLENRIFF